MIASLGFCVACAQPEPPRIRAEPLGSEIGQVTEASAEDRTAIESALDARFGARPRVRAALRHEAAGGAVSFFALHERGALEACLHSRGSGARAACRREIATGPDGEVSSELAGCRRHGVARLTAEWAVEDSVRLDVGCRIHALRSFDLVDLDADAHPELLMDIETRGPVWRIIVGGDWGPTEYPVSARAPRRELVVLGHHLHTQLALTLYRRLGTVDHGQPDRLSRRVVLAPAAPWGITVDEVEYQADDDECAPEADRWPGHLEPVDEACRQYGDCECQGEALHLELPYEAERDRWRPPDRGRAAHATRPR